MSAVTTELILCADDTEIFEHVLSEGSLFSSPLLTEIKGELDVLQKHLKYAQSFWQKDENEMQSNPCQEKKNNVYLAIHSLSLHMQAALCKVQDLEKRFEHLEPSWDGQDGEEKITDELPSYEFVQDQLNLIQVELQSCEGCLDETSVRVGRKYAIEEEEAIKEDSDLPVNTEVVTSVAPAKKAPIPLFDLEEPVIQDEVFEACVDQDYLDNRDKDVDDMWSSDAKQERRKIKQQKAQGKRVLHELQPLLHKLREEWEERETAALQRQKTEVSQALYGNHFPVEEECNGEADSMSGRLLDSERSTDAEKEDEINVEQSSCRFGNLSSSGHNDFEDSDDERLEAYRKVKRELEMEDNAIADSAAEDKDSDDERLEIYRKVRRELELEERCAVDAADKINDDERSKDSDDERLEIYRKVRGELELEERSAVNAADQESNDERREVYERTKTELDTEEERKTTSELLESDNRRSKSEVQFSPPRVPGLGLLPVQSLGESDGCVQETKTELNPFLQALLECSEPTKDRRDVSSALLEEIIVELPSNIVPPSNLKCDDTSILSSKNLEEEVFVHGEDINDDDNSPRIDWSTVTLPMRMTDTLEDRMQLFCGGQNRGFHADLAAEAQAASLQFLSNKGESIQTFRGVGEGEEEFGDEDSD